MKPGYLKLIALHGKKTVDELLPLVAKKGFVAICETPKHPRGEYIKVWDDSGTWIGTEYEIPWVPAFPFSEKELWETVSGYRRDTVPRPQVTVMTEGNKYEFETGSSAGYFLANVIIKNHIKRRW